MRRRKGFAAVLAGLVSWLWPGAAAGSETASVGRSRPIRAKYDSAQTTENNRRHWAWADALSADSAASVTVRKLLRERARYEVANNSYAAGILGTLANDVVGTGPRLQLLEDEDASSIERAFAAWAKAIGMPAKLRTMVRAWAQDGESFGFKAYNPKIEHAVKLDLRLVEADQVTALWLDLADADSVQLDGLTLDEYGNVASYAVLKRHPGSLGLGALLTTEYDTIPARDVVHLFRQDRPGQHRGVPLMTPGLQLFPQMRRFTLAVLTAAEVAADIAAVTYTDSPPDDQAVATNAMETVEIDRGVMTTLPAGWKISQLEAQQPTTTYPDFKRQILAEAARGLDMPYNVAAADSSQHNYASGRLDYQTYGTAIDVNRELMETVVLDPFFRAWKREYELVTGRVVSDVHEWFWPGRGHVDPQKEANAQKIRLESNTTTLKAEYAAQGKDWQAELTQRGLEVAYCRELGLTTAQAAPSPAMDDEEEHGEEEHDDEEEAEAR